MALLDTSSSVSLVCAHLVPEGRTPLRLTVVTNVIRQVQQWLVIQMTLGYDNQTHTFEVLKVDDLSFLVHLGRDPWFGAMV